MRFDTMYPGMKLLFKYVHIALELKITFSLINPRSLLDSEVFLLSLDTGSFFILSITVFASTVTFASEFFLIQDSSPSLEGNNIVPVRNS